MPQKQDFGIKLRGAIAACAILTVFAVFQGSARADDLQTCAECHEDEVASFKTGLHSKAFTRTGKVETCATCHGPSGTHATDKDKESIISFSKGAGRTAAELNKQCLTCHQGSKDLAFWNQGSHSRNDVSCASCHSMHKGVAATKPAGPETCFTCHKDVKAQANKTSHHPIIEGKVSCWDCHNPHGAPSHGNLRADNINQLCYKCHADKRGPFIWEHAPVEENCMTCHTAHGSQHDKLLIAKTGNALCMNCHTDHFYPFGNNSGFGGSATQQAIARQCMNCHNRIHGSNAPANTNNTRGSGNYFLR